MNATGTYLHSLHLLLCHVVSMGIKFMLQLTFFSAVYQVYVYTRVWSLEWRCTPEDAQAAGGREGRKCSGTDLWRFYGHRVTWLGELDPKLKKTTCSYMCVCIYIGVHTYIYSHEYIMGLGKKSVNFNVSVIL